jgi:hypothetical protein
MNPSFPTLSFPFFPLPVWPGLAAVDTFVLSSGRIGAVTAALLGLAGIIISLLAFRRQKSGVGTGRRGAFVALASAMVGILLGSYVVVTSPAGVGTGNGHGGAYVAIVVSTLAVVLATRALARARAR